MNDHQLFSVDYWANTRLHLFLIKSSIGKPITAFILKKLMISNFSATCAHHPNAQRWSSSIHLRHLWENLFVQAWPPVARCVRPPEREAVQVRHVPYQVPHREQAKDSHEGGARGSEGFWMSGLQQKVLQGTLSKVFFMFFLGGGEFLLSFYRCNIG